MNPSQERPHIVSSDLKALLQVFAMCAAIAAFAMVPFLSAAQQSVPKPTTVLIHPGETLYVTFQRTGDSLMLDHVGTDADKTAQLILKMAPLKEIHGVTLNVQNDFDKTLHYRAEMHSLSKNKKASTTVVPVRPGKFSFESWPFTIEELELSGFELKDK
jgi:hypothetical protein